MERKEAHLRGLKKYNTGRPCRYGHMGDRLVSSAACVECLSAYGRPHPLVGYKIEVVLRHKDDVTKIQDMVSNLNLERDLQAIDEDYAKAVKAGVEL